MRSIFWKIFLWFWLAFALVAGAYFAMLALARPKFERVHAVHFVRSWLPSEAEHAANLYERGSPQALQTFLKDAAEPMGGSMSLYRTNGESVLGGPPSKEIGGLVQQAAGAHEIVSNGDNIPKIFAMRIQSFSGQDYVYSAELGRRPFPFLLQAPLQTQLSRLAVVLAVAAVVCLWLAHHITSPILRLQRAARSIASGQLDVRIHPQPAKRWDEIAGLEHDFDAMAERLENLMTSQQRLLQAISHELRSPLARLNVAVGLARQRPGEDQTMQLDRIEREAGSLNEMISQMLALFREERGGAAVTQGILDLGGVVAEVAADAQFEASSVNRSVLVTHSEPCFVHGNDRLLRSAIENVVRNAVRYTREHSSVEVALRREMLGEKAVAVLRVVDHGPGVPEESLADIFQPFFRLHDARERETGGTGLGLAITDHAIRLHGGNVSAQNSGDGGLVVVFQLPLIADS